MSEAGFDDVEVQKTQTKLRLPAPEDFLWQYIHSTPLAGLVGKATDAQRTALVVDIRKRWQKFVVDEALILDFGMTTVRGK
jgi:hypothetical protein